MAREGEINQQGISSLNLCSAEMHIVTVMMRCRRGLVSLMRLKEAVVR
jgi:hypothetical protein